MPEPLEITEVTHQNRHKRGKLTLEILKRDIRGKREYKGWYTGELFPGMAGIPSAVGFGGAEVERLTAGEKQQWVDRFDEMIRLLLNIERSNDTTAAATEDTRRSNEKIANRNNGPTMPMVPASGFEHVER